jgi:hypothetical protein
MAEFRWCVSTGGYRWVPGATHQTLVQQARVIDTGPVRQTVVGWRTYCPGRESPPLFRRFADLVVDERLDAEAALQFAHQFGHLCLHAEVEGPPPEGGLFDEARQRGCKRVSAIIHPTGPPFAPETDTCAEYVTSRVSISDTRCTVEVAAKLPDWRRLCGLPDWAEQYRPFLDGDTTQGFGLGETFALWERNAKVMQTLLALYDGLDQSASRERDRMTLEQYIGEELDGRVQVVFDRPGTSANGTPAGYLDLRPRDLLGFLWLQFARQVSGAEEFRRCPNCGEYFSPRRDGLTANQKVAPKRIRKKYSHSRFCTAFCQKEWHYKTATIPKRQQAKLESARKKKLTSRATAQAKKQTKAGKKRSE